MCYPSIMLLLFCCMPGPIFCLFSESWRTTLVAMSQKEMHHCCCRPCWPEILASSGRKVLRHIEYMQLIMTWKHTEYIVYILCTYIYIICFFHMLHVDVQHLIVFPIPQQMLCSSLWYHSTRLTRIPCIVQHSLGTSNRQPFLPILQGRLNCKTDLCLECESLFLLYLVFSLYNLMDNMVCIFIFDAAKI